MTQSLEHLRDWVGREELKDDVVRRDFVRGLYATLDRADRMADPLVVPRLIHWLRDAALLDASGRRRQMEEIGLTMLFLGTLAVWRNDASEGQAETSAWLRRRLARADRQMAWLWGAAPPAGPRKE